MRTVFLVALLVFQGLADDAVTTVPPPAADLPVPDDAQKCYTGDLTVDDKKFTMPEVMKMLEPLVGASIVSVVSKDKGLKEFFKSKGTCQLDCLQVVLSSTFPALYGKLGEDFGPNADGKIKHEAKEIIIEGVTGAIRACYPMPKRSDVRMVAEQVVVGIGKEAASTAEFPEGIECANAGEEASFPLDDFLTGFKEAFGAVVESKPKVLNFFQTRAKDCQIDCLDTTVPQAVMTLFLTNNTNMKQGIDAMTGAMHACFPGVPQPLILAVVKETADSMQKAQATATTRLYSKKLGLLKSQGSYGFFPMAGIAAAAGLVLFYVGVVVGRHSKRYAQVQEKDEAQELIANEGGDLE